MLWYSKVLSVRLQSTTKRAGTPTGPLGLETTTLWAASKQRPETSRLWLSKAFQREEGNGKHPLPHAPKAKAEVKEEVEEVDQALSQGW